jgi:hypothetical protein
MSDPVAGFATAVSAARAAVETCGLPEAEPLRAARWVGVDGETWWWTQRPPEPATAERELWRSAAAGRLGANTRISIDGASWAQVVLPLPDGDAGVRLLVHEAWHAWGQPEPGHSQTPGDDFLETVRGRALLRCQLAALSAALEGNIEAAADAERIRSERLASVAERERARQGWLEEHEGRPESVAWEVTRGTDEQLREHLAADLTDVSLTRAFAYWTEPARRRVLARHPDLRPVEGSGDEVLARHGFASVLAQEEARAEAREEERRRRDLAYEGEVLRLRLDPPELVFDPRRVQPHRLGTWYGTLEWRHTTGAQLTVTDGCVIDSGWTTVIVARPEPTAHGVRGPGWALRLPTGVELSDLTT